MSLYDRLREGEVIYDLRFRVTLYVNYKPNLFLDKKYLDSFRKSLEVLPKKFELKFEMVASKRGEVILVFRASPDYSLEEIGSAIKTAGQKHVFGDFPEVKKEFWGGRLWKEDVFFETLDP